MSFTLHFRPPSGFLEKELRACVMYFLGHGSGCGFSCPCPSTMVPEAACRAEGKVKVVKRNQALERGTTAAAAPGGRGKWQQRLPSICSMWAFSTPPSAPQSPRASHTLSMAPPRSLDSTSGGPTPPCSLYILDIADYGLRDLWAGGSHLGSQSALGSQSSLEKRRTEPRA